MAKLKADRDRAILQPFQERALRLERDAVDLVEQNDFGGRERAELRHQLAGGRVDHLEPDDLGRLQVGAPLQPHELRIADRRQDDAEKRLTDAGHAAQEQVAGVHLALLLLVVRGWDLRHQDDVGERFRSVVANERFPAFGDDLLVKCNSFL
jgi:hypothetical protein